MITLKSDHMLLFEPVHEISNNVVCATSKASEQPVRTRSLIRAFAGPLSILQGFPFKKKFRGHCDPQVVDFGDHFQFERVTYCPQSFELKYHF